MAQSTTDRFQQPHRFLILVAYSFEEAIKAGRQLMTYATTTIPQKLSQRVAKPIHQPVPRRVCQNQLLIVCCGNELRGDAAVGPLIAMTVSNWGLASARSIVVNQFTPELLFELARTDYVIFVEPCAENDCTRTAQFLPIVVDCTHSEAIRMEAKPCSPYTLLRLAQKFHNSCPQSWLLTVPTEDFRFARGLSSTAKTGINQALKTIMQFLRTYQLPQDQLIASS